MMSGLEITCANKDQRGMIIRIGGDNWSLGIHEAITKLLSQQLIVYVRFNDTFATVGVRGKGGDAFLALEPDGLPLHDLSSLPSC
jgi:hypothetical protein